MIFELIPGTVEEANPFDSSWTDEEYGDHLRDLYAAGSISSAQAFPAVLGAESGDPRTSRYDASIRPWFVFFDGRGGRGPAVTPGRGPCRRDHLGLVGEVGRRARLGDDTRLNLKRHVPAETRVQRWEKHQLLSPHLHFRESPTCCAASM